MDGIGEAWDYASHAHVHTTPEPQLVVVLWGHGTEPGGQEVGGRLAQSVASAAGRATAVAAKARTAMARTRSLKDAPRAKWRAGATSFPPPA